MNSWGSEHQAKAGSMGVKGFPEDDFPAGVLDSLSMSVMLWGLSKQERFRPGTQG